MVEKSVVVEVKALDAVAPIHLQQLYTYLRLGDYRLGLLLNFGGATLKEDGKAYSALAFCSATVAANRITPPLQYAGIVEDYRSTFAKTKVMKVDIPQLGQEVEQTTEFFDYKEVDGVKVPFRIKTSSSIQTITITLTGIEHNVKVDSALFVKPGAL